MVIVRSCRSKTVEEQGSRRFELTTLERKRSTCQENLAAGIVVCICTEALCFGKAPVGLGKLLEMRERYALEGASANTIIYRADGCGAKKLQSFLIHATPHHGLCIEQMEFRSPAGVQIPEVAVRSFRFFLAFRQIAMQEELLAALVRKLRVNGPRVSRGNEQEESQRP